MDQQHLWIFEISWKSGQLINVLDSFYTNLLTLCPLYLYTQLQSTVQYTRHNRKCLINLISGDNELRKPLQFSNQLYSKTNLEVSVLRDYSVFKACFDNTVSILKIYCTVDTKKILLENFSLFSLLFLCSSTGKLVIFLLDRQTPGCLLCFLSDRIFLISQ